MCLRVLLFCYLHGPNKRFANRKAIFHNSAKCGAVPAFFQNCEVHRYLSKVQFTVFTSVVSTFHPIESIYYQKCQNLWNWVKPVKFTLFTVSCRFNICAFCLRMREFDYHSVENGGFRNCKRFVVCFIIIMDWIFIRSVKMSLNHIQVRLIVSFQLNSTKIHNLLFKCSTFFACECLLCLPLR